MLFIPLTYLFSSLYCTFYVILYNMEEIFGNFYRLPTTCCMAIGKQCIANNWDKHCLLTMNIFQNFEADMRTNADGVIFFN